MNFKYKLEKYSGKNSRYTCPNCRHKHSFVRYVDEQNKYIANHVGRCNREIKCGYHLKPKEYFNQGNEHNHIINHNINCNMKSNYSVSYIPNGFLYNSLRKYECNNFVKFLERNFGGQITNEVIEKYFIGTSAQFNYSTVFWQIDDSLKIRTGKIIKYDENGHRVKDKINYVHSILKIKNFELKQCLFGLHLLRYDKERFKKICIVESEKTAVICSVLYPEHHWLATSGLQNLNYEKIKELQASRIVFIPDLGAYQIWQKKIRDIFTLLPHAVYIDLINLKPYADKSDIADGNDIADLLLKGISIKI